MVHIREDETTQVNAVRLPGEPTTVAKTAIAIRCVTCECFIQPGQSMRLSTDGSVGRHLNPKDCTAT